MRRRKGGYRGEVAGKVSIPGQIVPDKMIVHLPYVINIISPANIAVFATTMHTAAYDPEFAVGGHQPMGYDQYAVFYENCRVFGVTGTVKFINQTDLPWFVKIGYTPDVSTIPPIGSTEWFEQPGDKPRLMGLPTGGHDVVTIPVHCSAAQILGMTKLQYKTELGTAGTMGSTSGTVPPIVAYFVPSGWTVGGGLTTTGRVTYLMDLVFHCELFGRRPLPTS